MQNHAENCNKKNPFFPMSDALEMLGRTMPKSKTPINCISPDHPDRNPSCVVGPFRYKCMSCGATGDSIEAVRLGRGLKTRAEALELIKVEKEVDLLPPKDAAIQSAMEIKIAGLETFHRWSQIDTKPAQDYLKSRGIRWETAQDYGIGYIKNIRFDDFLMLSPEEKRAETELLFRGVGLISSADNFLFANRLTIPTYHHGRVVALSGRIIQSGDIRPKHVHLARGDETPLPEVVWNHDEIYGQIKIYLTEAVLDALTLVDRGILNVAAINGIQGLTKAKLKSLKAAGVTEITLVFDTDPNGAGQKAVIETGKLLFAARMTVRVIRLPAPNGAKCDVNSYFQSGRSVEEFRGLPETDWFELFLDTIAVKPTDSALQRAETMKEIYDLIGRMPEAFQGELLTTVKKRFPGLSKNEIEGHVRDFSNKHKRAQELTPYKIYMKLCRNQHVVSDLAGNVFRYENGVYSPWEKPEISKNVIRIRKQRNGSDPTSYDTREVLEFLRAEGYQSEESFNPPDRINLRNGVYNIVTRQVEPHTPTLFFTIQLPFNYDPNARCPRFLSVLKQILPNETDRILLQEIYGICLTRETKYQKAFVWTGEGRNGKGLLWTILMAIIGEQNVSFLSIPDMGERFRQIGLRHKLLNITDEVNAGDRIDDGIFKSLVVGTKIRAEEKFKASMDFKPYCKFLICCNNLPRTRDFTDGFFRRLVIIPFKQSFKGKNDNKDLFNEIVPAELPGIFNFALNGLARLQHDRDFIESTSAQVAMREYRLSVDHVLSFVENEIELCPGAELEFSVVFSKFKDWSAENNYAQMTAATFGGRFAKSMKEQHGDFQKKTGNGFTFYMNCRLRGSAPNTGHSGYNQRKLCVLPRPERGED